MTTVDELHRLATAFGLTVTRPCACCGAPLFAALSLERGQGPVCWSRTQNDPGASRQTAHQGRRTPTP